MEFDTEELILVFLLKGSGLIELFCWGLLMHLSLSLGPLGMGGDINNKSESHYRSERKHSFYK